MSVRTLLVPTLALFGIGAVFMFVSPFTALLPEYFSLPLLTFWICVWYLDARFTAKHWRLVLNGKEANVLVLMLARISPRKPSVVFAVHAVFSVGAAAGMQALVTHSLDYLVMSCILAVFGILHVEGFCQSRAFMREMARAR